MKWEGRRNETFFCRRVTFPDWCEREDYPFAVSGAIDLSALSDLRASGSLSFDGDEPPESGSLMRIYYRFEDENGDSETDPIGTFFVNVADRNHDGASVSGKADLESVLKVAMADCYGRPYTVPKGTNAVARARTIIEGLGLRTNKPTCSYTLKSEMTFEPGDTWLSIANALLDAAGYAACTPDAYGTVQMCPYVEPELRQPTWTFADNQYSIMEPEVAESSNAGDIPNVVRLLWENEEGSLWACAKNNDPESAASYKNRGYWQGDYELVSELDGSNQNQRLANLKALSKKKLLDKTQEIEYVEWSHPWVPLWPSDAVEISYLRAGRHWRGAVVSMALSIGDHLSVKSRARRFVHAAFNVTTEGGGW